MFWSMGESTLQPANMYPALADALRELEERVASLNEELQVLKSQMDYVMSQINDSDYQRDEDEIAESHWHPVF